MKAILKSNKLRLLPDDKSLLEEMCKVWETTKRKQIKYTFFTPHKIWAHLSKEEIDNCNCCAVGALSVLIDSGYQSGKTFSETLDNKIKINSLDFALKLDHNDPEGANPSIMIGIITVMNDRLNMKFKDIARCFRRILDGEKEIIINYDLANANRDN